jgi:hypothetical protein
MTALRRLVASLDGSMAVANGNERDGVCGDNVSSRAVHVPYRVPVRSTRVFARDARRVQLIVEVSVDSRSHCYSLIEKRVKSSLALSVPSLACDKMTGAGRICYDGQAIEL